jgi:serine/threonine-protein kinase
MTLTAGARLGPYEILSSLGAGGMGEVYRARDAKLNRDVALKVLPDLLAGDPDRLARFRREAQVLAVLNHPNIAHIYGFEDSGAIHAIVMELVEGPTLADRIAAGAIPLAEALPIARQIAEALEAAHEQGIVHRDLKPANVKVRDDGAVKVLDFGLAKALGPDGSGATPDAMNSPTLTARATQMGTILGTAAYMAPEQARGKTVDKRADVWAFGVVLYEMLTGTRAFGGDNIAETLASVLKDTPPLDGLPAGTPVRLRRLLERCLDRDVKQRLRDIGEARIAIAKIEAGEPDVLPGSTPASIGRTARRALPWALLAAVCVALAATLLTWSPWRAAPTFTPVTFQYPLPEGHSFSHAGSHVLAISPNGTMIAYVADHQLYLRPIDRLEAQPIRGTNEDPFEPVFSPDGEYLAYFVMNTTRATGGSLKKVAITGGAPVTLCKTTTTPFGASWRNGTIAFGQNGPTIRAIQSVLDTGGTVRTLVTVESRDARAIQPQLLDDGQHVLFTIAPTLEVGGESQIFVQALDGSQRKLVMTGGGNAQVLSNGQLVYVHNGILFARPFDTRRLPLAGGEESLVEGVHAAGPIGAWQYAVSREGTLAYWPGRSPGAHRVLVWVNRQGKEQPIAAEPRDYEDPRLSPDGTKIAVAAIGEGHGIWIWDIVNERLTQLTHGSATEMSPVWMPDGQRIVFRSIDAGHTDIFRIAADGTGAAEALTTGGSGGDPLSISRDTKQLVFQTPGGRIGLMILPVDGGGPPMELLVDPAINHANAAISPDGRWIAYQSNETKTPEVYVRPFPAVKGGRSWMVSHGGSRPAWAPSGLELFYVEGPQETRLMRVAIRPGTSFSYEEPQAWVDIAKYSVGKRNARGYDVAADGRFLMLKQVGDDAPIRDAIVVVTHWFDQIKAKVK